MGPEVRAKSARRCSHTHTEDIRTVFNRLEALNWRQLGRSSCSDTTFMGTCACQTTFFTMGLFMSVGLTFTTYFISIGLKLLYFVALNFSLSLERIFTLLYILQLLVKTPSHRCCCSYGNSDRTPEELTKITRLLQLRRKRHCRLGCFGLCKSQSRRCMHSRDPTQPASNARNGILSALWLYFIGSFLSAFYRNQYCECRSYPWILTDSSQNGLQSGFLSPISDEKLEKLGKLGRSYNIACSARLLRLNRYRKTRFTILRNDEEQAQEGNEQYEGQESSESQESLESQESSESSESSRTELHQPQRTQSIESTLLPNTKPHTKINSASMPLDSHTWC